MPGLNRDVKAWCPTCKYRVYWVNVQEGFGYWVNGGGVRFCPDTAHRHGAVAQKPLRTK